VRWPGAWGWTRPSVTFREGILRPELESRVGLDLEPLTLSHPPLIFFHRSNFFSSIFFSTRKCGIQRFRSVHREASLSLPLSLYCTYGRWNREGNEKKIPSPLSTPPSILFPIYFGSYYITPHFLGFYLLIDWLVISNDYLVLIFETIYNLVLRVWKSIS
jgi:hypothetical protein